MIRAGPLTVDQRASHVCFINCLLRAQLDGHSLVQNEGETEASGDFYLVKEQETAEAPRGTQQVIRKRHLTMNRAVPAHFQQTITPTFNAKHQLCTGIILSPKQKFSFFLKPKVYLN